MASSAEQTRSLQQGEALQPLPVRAYGVWWLISAGDQPMNRMRTVAAWARVEVP